MLRGCSRYIPFAVVVIAWGVATTSLAHVSPWIWLPLTVLVAAGVWDLLQPRHALFRNYPLSGRIRFASEAIGPQIRQYFVESDIEGKPFDREQRSLVYQRAKSEPDTMPFGTERIVTAAGYEWVNHSVAPKAVPEQFTRTKIGGDQCTKPYDSSLLNISAMSFGALSGRAIEALNRGAEKGGFAHDSGEGGLSEHHLKHNGDLIWEIGTGYFGCRTNQGGFDLEAFAEKASLDQVKMIQIKLSQGAKPGHGGILPAAKVSARIAAAVGVASPNELTLAHFYHRTSQRHSESLETLYERLAPGAVLRQDFEHPIWRPAWNRASASSFAGVAGT